MPLVRIDVVRGRTPDQKRAILEAVHAALVECFHIPAHDRIQILAEHDAADFERPPGASEAFTLVAVDAFPGRTADAKAALFAAVVRHLERAAAIPAKDVFVVIRESGLENWGIRGGQQASAVKLGFTLQV